METTKIVVDNNLKSLEESLATIDESIKELQKFKQNLVNIIITNSSNVNKAFEIWKKYSDKKHYNFINQIPDILRGIISTVFEVNRYEAISYRMIIASVKDKIENGKLDEEDLVKIKKEIMESNLSTVLYDW